MPSLDSLWKRKLASLEPAWEQVFAILGDTATVLPLVGLGNDGLPNAASFTTRRRHASGLEAVFTWSDAPSAFDKPFDPTDPASWQGIVPIISFNGTDEEADTPDADYWSLGDGLAGGDLAVSMGAWVLVPAGVAANSIILAKYDAGAAEWYFQFGTTQRLEYRMQDASAAVGVTYTQDTGFSTGTWHHVVVTRPAGGTGGTAMDSVVMYVDGAAVAGTAANNAGYVGSEPSASLTRLAAYDTTPSNLLNGSIAGGPFGPFFTQVELTAAQVKRLYHLGRAAMGLA